MSLRGLHPERVLLSIALFGAAWAAIPACLTAQNAPQAQSAGPSPAPGSFAPLVARVKPAVVNIATTELVSGADASQLPETPDIAPDSPLGRILRQFQGSQQQGPVTLHALGSESIIEPAGYVVTNNHVVANGTKIQVTLADGATLDAKLVGHDELTDLAVLKIDAGHPLPFVQWGDSDALQVGDWILSVGNPFGLGGSVTAGILSARGRDIGSGPYDDYLQIDAPINQGNSGGPTFDATGKVIGINTAILSPNGGGSVGIGFAIPSNIARDVVAQLVKDGRIERGWLGVGVQPVVPAMEESLGVKSTDGALVAQVMEGSPAARAGVRPGDVILGFDHHPIKTLHDLTWAAANSAVGTSVVLDTLRNGEKTQMTVTIAAMPEQQSSRQAAPVAASDRLGLSIARLTPALRRQIGIPDQVQGVLVTDVADGSAADDAGVQEGDVIERIGNRAISSPTALTQEIDKAQRAKSDSVTLLIDRSGQDQFVVVRLTAAK